MSRKHKLSISEKSEENKSVQSDLKQGVLDEMAQFQFGNSGVWGGDPRMQDGKLYDTIRNIALNKKLTRKLTSSMVRDRPPSPQDGFGEPDELSELEPGVDSKMALYNKLLNNYAVDVKPFFTIKPRCLSI